MAAPNTAVAKNVRCPQCAGTSLFSPDNPFRPFCSERCKLLDLGAWANDAYAIPGSPMESPMLDDGASPDKTSLQ